MLDVTDAGGIIYPPFLSFYQRPDSLEEAVTRTMARALSFQVLMFPSTSGTA